MAESFLPVAEEEQFLPVRTPQRMTTSFGGLLRQGGAGIAQVLPTIGLGIPGALGYQPAADAYRTTTDAINNFMGVEDPNWREDPTGFAAREIGSAVVGLPARGVTGIYSLLNNAPDAVRIAARGLEAITPLTLPLTGRNIAYNAVGGGLAGVGMQEMQSVEQDARDAEVRRTVEAAQRLRYSGEIPQPEQFLPVNEGETFAPLNEQAPRTVLGSVAPYVAPVFLGLGATTGVALGTRAVLADRAARQAQDVIGVTNPGRDPTSVAADPVGTEAFVQDYINAATPLTNTINDMEARGVLPADAAARLRAYAGTRLSEAPRSDQINEILDTGYIPLTQQRILSKQEFELPISQLSPVDRAELAAALNVGNERNNRAYNAQEGNLANYNGQMVPARVNMWDRSDAELDRMYQQYTANPRIAPLIQAYRTDMADGGLAFLERSGLKSAQDVAAMRAAHPDYVHTVFARERGISETHGVLVRTTETNTPVTERTYTDKSGSLQMQDPFIARNEFWRKAIDQGMVNDAIRSIAKYADQYQRTLGPNDMRHVGRVIAPQAPPRDGFRTVSVIDNGVVKNLEVSVPMLDLLRAVPKATVPVLSGIANTFRSFTTGPVGALLGSVMAPVSAGMAAGAIAVTKPASGRAGVFDGAVRSLTGNRVGLPGDPTFLLQAAGQFMRDFTSQNAQWVFNAVQRSQIQGGMLARVLGPTGTVNVMRRMDNFYNRSTLAAMRRTGATGTGLTYDPSLPSTLQPSLQALTPELRRALPVMRNPQTLGDYLSIARQYAAKATPIQLERGWNMWKQTLDIMSGSATSAYFRLNRGQRGMSDTALAGEARQLSGDPSAMGRNRLWQGFLSTTPYSNITVQSVAQYGRAFKNTPENFVFGLVLASTVPPLLSLASAIYADMVEEENGRPRQYVAHLLMQSSNQATGDQLIYVPGVKPAQGFRQTPDQTIRPLQALAQAIFIEMLGADKPEFWTPEMAPLRNGFVDLMADRTQRNFWAAMNTAIGQVNLNPAITAGVQIATGADLSNTVNFVNPSVRMQRDVGMVGYEDRQGSNDPVPRTLRTILEHGAGASAEPILGLITTGAIAALAEGGEPLAAAMDELAMRQMGGLRQIAPLLQQQRRLVQRDAVGDVLQAKEASMERIMQGSADFRRPGTVGSGDSVSVAGVGRQPPPADMIPLLAEAAAVYGRGQLKDQRERRASLQQQILAHENDPVLANNPQERLRVINEKVQQIRMLNQQMYVTVQAFEARQTLQTGRRVRLERLDPQRGLDQFPALQ